MSDIKVADPHGQWYLNTGLFRMHDPLTDTYFEPGIPTKATKSTWLTGTPEEGEPAKPKYKPGTPGQTVIIEIEDPHAPEIQALSAEAIKQARIQKHGEDPQPKK